MSNPVKALVLLGSVAALGGCATRFTEDVELQSVETVNWTGSTGSLSAGWVPYTAPTEDLSQEVGKETHTLLKVLFTTRVNIPKFTNELANRIRVDASFCDRPDELVSLSSGTVHLPIQKDEPAPSWWQTESAEQPIEYFFLMYLDGQNEKTSHVEFHAFDLVDEPRDVCFTLIGHRWLDPGYKSNTVILTAAMIEAALRNLPPAYR